MHGKKGKPNELGIVWSVRAVDPDRCHDGSDDRMGDSQEMKREDRIEKEGSDAWPDTPLSGNPYAYGDSKDHAAWERGWKNHHWSYWRIMGSD